MINDLAAYGAPVMLFSGGAPVVRDQVEWNGVTWTAALMEGNKVRKVGVRFPGGQGKPGPSLFL